MERFNEAYEFFNDHKDMKSGISVLLGGSTEKQIESSFQNCINFLKKFETDLEKEEKYTQELEQQFNQSSQ